MSHNLIEPTPSAYAYPLLIKTLLHTALTNAPDQQIVFADRLRYDYRTFHDRIRRLAGALTDLGVRPGDTVGVLDWDSHRYLESYFAVPSMGAVLHMVNVRLSPEQILYTINHAEDDILLVHVDFLPMLEGIKDRIERVRTIVLLSDDNRTPATTLEFAGEYEALLGAGSSDFEFPDFDENTRATTFYTTGTTGLPKGVNFSHRQLVLHTLAVAATFGANPVQGRFHRGDVYMPITPMFHVHAWGFPFIATMLGVKQVYPGRYTPELLVRLFVQEKVTFSHCVPTLLHMILTCPEARDVDMRGWKVVIGGSALSKGLATMALERGLDVFAGYGMSETCPVMTLAHLPPGRPAGDVTEDTAMRGKAGRAIPLVELQIIGADGTRLPFDGQSAGEVVARAPWLTQNYFKNAKASEELWSGGYLHTGDIGTIDESGWLQITDRAKDVIKTGGEWVSSLEIEDILSQHPAVSEAAVVAVPDQRWGERPLALVVLKAGSVEAATAQQLREHVGHYADKGLISKYAVPDTIRLIDAIPRTSVGKVDKKALRQSYTTA
ncbi:MAG TPA: fatty acid--CoA ligase [Acetobacteraceae bacterium]|nr:fatty acid--CoA ligase [Acetobacteraceae bacterium]